MIAPEGFRADPERGAFYEYDDPTPGGTPGRLYMPMLADGGYDLDDLAEIEVTYEEA